MLSRFPIISSDHLDFGFGLLSDSIAMKGALYAKIDISGKLLHLFTTHLQASYPGLSLADFKATLRCRLEQVLMLREFIISKTGLPNLPDDELVILAGDMNVNGCDDKRHRKMRELSVLQDLKPP